MPLSQPVPLHPACEGPALGEGTGEASGDPAQAFSAFPAACGKGPSEGPHFGKSCFGLCAKLGGRMPPDPPS